MCSRISCRRKVARRIAHADETPRPWARYDSWGAVALSALLFAVPAPALAASDTHARSRLVPSDTSVRPGDVVTMEVSTSTPVALGGGMNSYFERKRRSGGWQRLYMLAWYGRDEPTVHDPNSSVDDLLVRASPFLVVIPPVKPGEYRVTRSFLISPGITNEELVLSGRVTVRACHTARYPEFGPPPKAQWEPGACARPAASRSSSLVQAFRPVCSNPWPR